MNISLNWLNSYLDSPLDSYEAERVLTEIGFPLDGLESRDHDALLDVEVTSNRGDCLSHVGLARDIAAATARHLREPEVAPPPQTTPDAQSSTGVDNLETHLCPHYTARVIRGVRVAPSPDWLVRRLQSIGLRPVNNIVDVTNFVLHELGQPLHAFDLNRLDEKRIIVRKAAEGEPFLALDGSRHKLSSHMLVIADAHKPVALAGIMGGGNSEVSDQTVDILLESARFDPLNVRSTSRALKLASDSSYRFERGVDPQGVDKASRRAARLIVELAGGELAYGVISVGDPLPGPIVLTLRPHRATQLLGYELPPQRMVEMLEPLGLQPQYDGQTIACTVPSFRLDLRREVDVIEEIARLHGYEHIPMRSRIALTPRPPQPEVDARRELERVLTAHGYFEAITFSSLPIAYAQPFAGKEENSQGLVWMDQEQKKAEPALRPSILPSLLASRKTNQDAGNNNLRLFEIAQTFGRRDGEHHESRRIALLCDAPSAEPALREMRGVLEEMLIALGAAESIDFQPADDPPAWAQTASALIDGSETSEDAGAAPAGQRTAQSGIIGHYGPVTDALRKQFDLQTPVILGEIDYAPLIRHYPPIPRVQPPPRFPAIERDLSVVVDESLTWASIAESVRAARPPLLEHVRFVTTYRGKQIGRGRKSVTLRLTFRHPERTLEHEQVDQQVRDVVDRLKQDMGAELRG